MNKEIEVRYNQWLNSECVDKKDREELELIKNNEKEIESRFFQEISFGTAGIRGIRGIGTNRINKYMIRKATQGLANYINKNWTDKMAETTQKAVVIAYDCRIGSKEYAMNTGLVLAANGIKAYIFKDMHSTPELSFGVRHLKTISGIVITASHNPKEYNGYKVYWNDGAQLVEPQSTGVINEIERIKGFDEIKIMSEKEAEDSKILKILDDSIDFEYFSEIKKQALNIELKEKKTIKIVYTPLHGTGGRPVLHILKEMGFESIYPVLEQIEGDGTFPTCVNANPEDPNAFQYAIKLAERVGARICMANDPDADRIGIAVKNKENVWEYPSGNQIGLLILNYILENKKNIPENSVVISTIVSTPMLDVIAKEKQIKLYRTLTGFKYIGEKIRQFEDGELEGSYLFGFEESFGYLVGTHARDKDAIVTTMLLCEMIAYYQEKGTSILEELEKLYKKYGYYREKIVAVTKIGEEGTKENSKLMSMLRSGKDEKELIGKKIIYFRDYLNQIEKNIQTNKENLIDLPKSDVIQYVLEDGTYITVRPSGTEPKMKYYYTVNSNSEENAEKKLEEVVRKFEALV